MMLQEVLRAQVEMTCSWVCTNAMMKLRSNKKVTRSVNTHEAWLRCTFGWWAQISSCGRGKYQEIVRAPPTVLELSQSTADTKTWMCERALNLVKVVLSQGKITISQLHREAKGRPEGGQREAKTKLSLLKPTYKKPISLHSQLRKLSLIDDSIHLTS